MNFYKHICGKALADYTTRFVHLSTTLGKNIEIGKELVKKYDLTHHEEDIGEITDKSSSITILRPKVGVKIHESLITDFADSDEPKKSMGIVFGRRQIEYIGDCLLIAPKNYSSKGIIKLYL